MTTVVQEPLFDLSEITTYTWLDHELDRALCTQFLNAWLATGGADDVVTNGITQTDFEAACERLEQHAAL